MVARLAAARRCRECSKQGNGPTVQRSHRGMCGGADARIGGCQGAARLTNSPLDHRPPLPLLPDLFAFRARHLRTVWKFLGGQMHRTPKAAQVQQMTSPASSVVPSHAWISPLSRLVGPTSARPQAPSSGDGFSLAWIWDTWIYRTRIFRVGHCVLLCGRKMVKGLSVPLLLRRPSQAWARGYIARLNPKRAHL